MPLLVSNDDESLHSASIDKKLTIVVNREWTLKNDIYYHRTIYAYNNVGVFTTVLTETNEERSAEAAVTNPFDTFPKRYKYSGDYVKGTKNYLFIRDGSNPNEYRFFVHFSSGDEEEPCSGELKGIFKMAFRDRWIIYCLVCYIIDDRPQLVGGKYFIRSGRIVYFFRMQLS